MIIDLRAVLIDAGTLALVYRALLSIIRSSITRLTCRNIAETRAGRLHTYLIIYRITSRPINKYSAQLAS